MSIFSFLKTLKSRENSTESTQQPVKKTRTAYIHEELVAVTGHSGKAQILNYFIYQQYAYCLRWVPGGAGKVCKGALLTCSPSTANKWIKALAEDGFLKAQAPAKWSLNRDYLYQLNREFLEEKLIEHGYADCLEDRPAVPPVLPSENESKEENGFKPNEIPPLVLSDASLISGDAPLDLRDASPDMRDDLKQKQETIHIEENKQKQDCLLASKNDCDFVPGVTPPTSAAPPQAPEMTHDEAHELALSRIEAIKILESRGVKRHMAQPVAEQARLEVIREQCAAWPFRLREYEARGQVLKNPEGMLIRSIIGNPAKNDPGNWALPPAYLASLQVDSASDAENSLFERLQSATAIVTRSGKRYLIRKIREAAQIVSVVLESEPEKLISVPFLSLREMELES